MLHINDYLLYVNEYETDDYLTKIISRMDYVFAEIDEDKFGEYTVDDIKNILLNKINTYSQLYSMVAHFRHYCEWCVENKGCDDNILYILDDINLSDFWRNELSKADRIKQRYLKENDYQELIALIIHEDEYNALYYATMLMCIYEGVWDINWDTFRNLRLRDVDKEHHRVRIVRAEQDFWLEITPELTENLINLAGVYHWYRDNRNGRCEVQIEGKEYDSIFKIEMRKGTTEIQAQSFSRKLNGITKDYLDSPLKAQNIYLSGIIERINANARAEGIELHDLWNYHTRKKEYSSIIQDELDRIGYNVGYYTFRTMVQGIVNYFY